MRYTDAKTYCNKTGGELASFDNKEMYEESVRYVREHDPSFFSLITTSYKFWTGMVYNKLSVSRNMYNRLQLVTRSSDQDATKRVKPRLKGH